jgi:hypothetical protein
VTTASPLERVFARLVEEDEDHGFGELPGEVRDEVPGNAGRQVLAQSLQKVGDLIVDPKTVLSWLMAAVGAPAGFVGLLVPIRESGSMLPQAALVPLVRRMEIRKWLWVTGGVVQALAVVAMALATASLSGTAAGVAVLAALAVLAVARSLSSIASKDVLGRTVPKGARGRVNGWATIGGGIAAVTVGLGMRSLGGQQTAPSVFAWLLLAGAGAWLVAAVVYARVVEAPGADDRVQARAAGGALALLRDDAIFRRFVTARALLLVSALSPPFVVVLATRAGTETGLQGLGPFVLSSGIAALVGGQVWGRMADRSSRRVMMIACGAASTVVVAFLVVQRVETVAEFEWLYAATYLLLALTHHGSRIGRKTYVVDIAEGDRRTEYVAVSNTAMGVLLLLAGVVTAAVATVGIEAALALLAVLGYAGVLAGRSLPESTATGHDR